MNDYGMMMTEDILQEFIGATGLATGVALGAAGGAASGYLANDRNKKNLAKLKQAKAACGADPACNQRYDAMIAKYKNKIAGTKDSTIKRGIGGASTLGWGTMVHHPADALAKRRKMKAVIGKLKGQLSQCVDDACKKRVQAQIAAMKGKTA